MPHGKYATSPGRPYPLGISHAGVSVNFALYAKEAASVTLLFFEEGGKTPLFQIDYDPHFNRTGDVWHMLIEGLPLQCCYCYLVANTDSELFPLIDPYAKNLTGSNQWGSGAPFTREVTKAYARHPKARLKAPEEFDWQGDLPPQHPMQDLIIYEMHVRGFTIDPSSQLSYPGTFKGVIEKIPYLIELGVNAIELQPVTYFNECELLTQDPKKRFNYWGYSPVSFFALMNRYASEGERVVEEFKEMVRALHQAKIEVLLDLVFNHTAEGSEAGPIFSWKGLALQTYYLVNNEGHLLDYTGCGNTFNANHPVNVKQILAALRYFVAELHVDGFRFDLASALTRGSNGTPLSSPPLIEAISLDPLLQNVKLIAEAWDAAGLYHLGWFPNFGNWSEWNGRYRDAVRRFIKGTPGQAGAFATALCGSSDLYSSRGTPSSSINFITAHDGFTLRDLVSYNEKHNTENGEGGRDGSNQNDSWNCGVEGKTSDPKVLALRARQMRNFVLALLVSQGVPMLLMGDEYGHTKRGNNNTWCLDSAANWFLWDKLNAENNFFRFYKGLIDFRKKQPLLRRTHFLSPQEILWHGLVPGKPNWSDYNQFIAFTLIDATHKKDIYIAFNSSPNPVKVQLPLGRWHRIVDTSKKSPEDYCDENNAPVVKGTVYLLPAYSALLLQSW